MSGALNGVRVLDLSRVLAGPFSTMILGDLGAEVIKVEAPGGSDDTRAWGPPFKGGESAYYLCTNRNKKAITLNLKTEEGKAVLKRLVVESDVLIHNFKYGTMEKWQLGYEDLKKLNPRLIYCSITGFGSTGPYKELAGYDYIIQAMSGLMSITGSEESGPLKVGVAITDVITGLYAVIGITSALYERERSGEGQSIDLALFDSAVSALVNVASNYLISGQLPKLLGNHHPNIVPYQTFPTKDGEMVVAVGNDRQFKKLCTLIGKEEWAQDERFATNDQRVRHRYELEALLSEVFKQKTAAEWRDLLNQEGIPCGPINNMKELFHDPQVAAREMVVSMQHPTAGDIRLVGSPLKLSRTPVQFRCPPPRAGEHTREVLRDLGIADREIEALKEKGIL
ncbi:L-carnitine dehydratase/bile acid-inducible protein F [Caldalkalibacillus thermarum TA2.A1]|uniref:CoA transferase n=1 Tax=Caldalkalibacillus thermarum (strain TA2.A1) TaxID=986075 RepID=F5L7X3_CALTT|nr:CaiB/BaiF CoA-transferase family protein [Caldalkalibacillus thermarum]EGL82561.1 L-carnitine dehydratase/bile acid-inducible protein F [Caldalkalibacillus thermarum TA2.A1]QZT34789.1 CoA transferase [Caldalkalibacillus thermarum TA2.A1]